MPMPAERSQMHKFEWRGLQATQAWLSTVPKIRRSSDGSEMPRPLISRRSGVGLKSESCKLKINATRDQPARQVQGYGSTKPGDPIGRKRRSFRNIVAAAIRALALLLAVLVFVVPGAYLHAIWLRPVPPTPEQIDRAAVEVSEGAYRVSAPSGAKYVVSASVGSEEDARMWVRSQAADERATFQHAWAKFWFLLGGGFGASALLVLLSRASVAQESSSAGTEPARTGLSCDRV
jgi:hypothetical protein